MSAEGVAAAAWELTRAISPRGTVRVASVDAAGTVLNQYAATRQLQHSQPDAPWAVHLAGPDGYRLIAFDLDAKHGLDTVTADTATITRLLTAHGIAHLVCQSGPSGGQHIWTATCTPIDPSLVATLARLLAASCPSLDTAPLTNPATGCVRPPGSPHRHGSNSALLTGELNTLTSPTTTAGQLQQLTNQLIAAINGTSPHSPTDTAAAADGTTHIDSHGHPYLPGGRRALPRGSAAALEQPIGNGDASAQLWKVLIGAAASHWHHHDIAELVTTAPGLEHLRSRRGRTNRHPRSRYDTAQTLTRQWRYAVAYAAANPRSTGDDNTFDTRAGDLTDMVRALQQRADATEGRWRHGGGPTDRRVLDALHTFALTAVTEIVEADIRRLALTCGIGRETARVALARLTTDGWISLATPAAGVRGASWRITPHCATNREPGQTRSQAGTRPKGAGAAERTLLLEHLRRRIRLFTHDLFTGTRALPHRTGNTYALLSAHMPESFTDSYVLEDLERLRQHGLTHHGRAGWTRTHSQRRDAVATRNGVAGRLEERRRRYVTEREIWSWWQAEHDWMRTPRAQREHRSPTSQTPLWHRSDDPRYPKHPRRIDGRADYAAARAAHAAGVLHLRQLAA